MEAACQSASTPVHLSLHGVVVVNQLARHTMLRQLCRLSRSSILNYAYVIVPIKPQHNFSMSLKCDK